MNSDYIKKSLKYNPNLPIYCEKPIINNSKDYFEIIDLIDKVLIKNGVFVAKIWKGVEEKELINKLKKKFEFVSYFKPEASRKDSAEIFIIARNFNS